MARELCEERRLVGVIRQQELDLPEAAPFPPPETDEECERPGRRREARRLGVEAEEGSARRWLTRQSGEPLPIERQERRRGLDPDEAAAGRADKLPVELGGETLRRGR